MVVQRFKSKNAPETQCETSDNDTDLLRMTGPNHVQNIAAISI